MPNRAGKLKTNLENYKAKLLETWEELPLIFTTSSEHKKGKEEVLGYIEEINSSLKAT